MGRPEVYIEHHKDGAKTRKHLRVSSSRSSLFLIGSSKEANLRLAGEEINGCHAVLRYRDSHWYICDLSGTGATKIGGETFVERRIDETMEIEIGRHRLKLFSKERGGNLFASTGPTGDRGLHQVVVRVKGRVLDSQILPATAPYKFLAGAERRELAAPTSGDWVVTEIGNRVIQQRLVASQQLAEAATLEIDAGLKRPLLVAGALTLLLFLTIILMPKQVPQTPAEAVIPKKSMDMIFNAKAIKKKRAEVAKMSAKTKSAPAPSAAMTKNSAPPDEAMAPKVSPKTSAALTNIRQSGLSALVGKIAKRANKQGILVASSGISPDKVGSGRAFFSGGTATTGGGGSASKAGDTFRLGGVGTKGKGGGSGDFRAGTGLSGGSVGTGDVAVVDEETVVEGGLDREVIAEVIKRNIGQIRYCYERQLSSNRDLYGKVMVKFTIGASGAVGDPRIDATTMKNAMVEGCILRRLAGWKFPLPKGGTMVRVAYPFLFKAID